MSKVKFQVRILAYTEKVVSSEYLSPDMAKTYVNNIKKVDGAYPKQSRSDDYFEIFCKIIE